MLNIVNVIMTMIVGQRQLASLIILHMSSPPTLCPPLLPYVLPSYPISSPPTLCPPLLPYFLPSYPMSSHSYPMSSSPSPISPLLPYILPSYPISSPPTLYPLLLPYVPLPLHLYPAAGSLR